MNRLYSTKDFESIVNSFRDRFPDLTLVTDIIVGFPSETDEHFQHTVDLIKRLRSDIVNITRYSPRPFTKAKTMTDKIPTDIAKRRSQHLTALCRTISTENNQRLVGTKHTVLVTEQGTHNDHIGRTATYKSVVLKEPIELGGFYTVEITGVAPTYLVGNLI
jgi:tRNA A37 methylthiotransferase MiaB